MRPDAERTLATRCRLTTPLMAVLLVVALALVTPAAGPSHGNAHDFMSVHLLLPHHHDSFVPHGAVERDDRAENDTVMAPRQPALSSAEPIVNAASLASNSLVMGGLAFVLALRVLSLAGRPGGPAPRQRWDAVPVQPPR